MAAVMSSLQVKPLTCTIGAEVGQVNLGEASRSPELMAEIRALLLRYKVFGFRSTKR
ncbi:hypothetical protein LP414_23475 [Polaromonas sp. P1(28)-13]|nr:hypothetical protein LP414_23475 [Polaromonas sp. P1(28)-13]